MFRLARLSTVSSPAALRGLAKLREGAIQTVRHASLSSKQALPSNTTTLKLLALPTTLTETGLKDALKGVVDARKIEMEPGCALHVLTEAEASYAIQALSKASIDSITAESCSVTNIALPSLLLENIPIDVSVSALRDSMTKLGLAPVQMHINGCAALRATFDTDEDALRAAKMLRLVKKNGTAPTVHITNTVEDQYVVHATPGQGGTTMDMLSEAVKGAIPGVEVVHVAAAKRQLQLRYAQTVNDRDQLTPSVAAALSAVPGVAVEQDMEQHLPRPAVLFHRTGRFDEPSLMKKIRALPGVGLVTCKAHGVAKGDSIAAYFNTEADAMNAAAAMRNTTGHLGPNGSTVTTNKLSAVYRQIEVPTVRVSGLPKGAKEEQVAKLFKNFAPLAVHVKGEEALVTLNSDADIELATAALSRRSLHAGHEGVLTVTKAAGAGCDIGVTVSIDAAAAADTEELVLKALGGLNAQKPLSPLAASRMTNTSVFAAFKSSDDAVKAHDLFLSSKRADFALGTVVAGSTVTSKVSVVPAYAVEVSGLGTDTPMDKVLDTLATDGFVSPIGTDRSAILKFRRHLEIVPALQNLKVKVLEGAEKPLKVIRFRNNVIRGLGEYDNEDSEEAQHLRRFDSFSLESVLSDYMGADPGLRMQIAKSYFERALFDAKARDDITFLLSNNVADRTRDEALRLLKMDAGAKGRNQRLFELYVQREDMQRFTSDFTEMATFLGDPNAGDPFDWSEFKLSNSEDMQVLLEEMSQRKQEASDARALESGSSHVGKDVTTDMKKEKVRLRKIARLKRQRAEQFGEGDDEQGDSAGESGDEDEDEDLDADDMFVDNNVSLSLEDPSQRIDRDGHMWSGAILNTDMVQKTMPGNRVSTHRALVVIGNMRGAAGFGMGKAATPALAIDAAFRDATRNLVHIDLFDNYGLAHDVHGKHNSCQVYIKATPKSRAMVGSPFARAVLTRFGISSASCKIVGRRDPYAQVRAIFNAVSKHENIDEFAKERGQRYLTLRWIKKHGL